jgi:hypothetical protein
MAAPDILFKGIPRRYTRGYSGAVIRQLQPSAVVIPCCGSFALAATAVAVGYPAGGIVCGDISLYSTALGRAIMGEEWRLEVRHEAGEVVAPFLGEGPVGKAVAVLLMLRVLQYNRKRPTVYHRDRQQELVRNRELYGDQIRQGVVALKSQLEGLTYQARDLWETLEEHRNDGGALILMNPPRYDGGYERMFAGIDEVFDWDEPAYAMFKEADYARLMALLGESPASTLMYYATQGEDPSPLWGAPWRSVFADRPRNTKHTGVNWIVGNRDWMESVMVRNRLARGKRKYALFEGEIGEQTILGAVREQRDVADYYRDLFIHRLHGSLAEVFATVLLDGQLMGVVGLMMGHYVGGTLRPRGEAKKAKGLTAPTAMMNFAFSVPHPRYSRLHKLLLMSVLSSWFWDDLFAGQDWYEVLGPPAMLQSTMLTPHPENKTARGTGLEMLERHKLPEGGYRLVYRGTVVERTREETLALWRRKFGDATRSTPTSQS